MYDIFYLGVQCDRPLGAIGSIRKKRPYAFFNGGTMKLFKKKWTLYLYYNGVLIKKIKIDRDEAPNENSYVINVWFKKQIFKNNLVGIIVRPTRLLLNDEKKRKTYWGTVLETGIEI